MYRARPGREAPQRLRLRGLSRISERSSSQGCLQLPSDQHLYAPIVLNDDAMARGSAFYNAQVEESNTSINLGTVYCPRPYVTGDLRAHLVRHEEKHVEVFQTTRAFALADSIRAWEARVDSSGDAEMVDAYFAEWERTLQLGVAESRRVVDGRGSPYRAAFSWRGRPCILKNVFGADLGNEGEN